MVTHNEVISQMADVVIRLRSGQIDSIQANDQPISPKDLRW